MGGDAGGAGRGHVAPATAQDDPGGREFAFDPHSFYVHHTVVTGADVSPCCAIPALDMNQACAAGKGAGVPEVGDFGTFAAVAVDDTEDVDSENGSID